jgi:starch synthase (maltosyl-transferring)
MPYARMAREKIYYLHPLITPLPDWRPLLQRAVDLGFNCVCISPPFLPHASGNIFLTDDFELAHPAFGETRSADDLVLEISSLCREFELKLLLDIEIDRVAAGGAMARSAARWFGETPIPDRIDPRQPTDMADAVYARFDDPYAARELSAWWIDRLVRLAHAGAAGFRLIGLDRVPAAALSSIIRAVREEAPQCGFFGWTPGVPWAQLATLRGAGLDRVFASTAWWDGRASWFIQEHELLRAIAPVLGVVEAPFGERLASRPGTTAASYRRALRTAAAVGHGLLMPMGFEFAARRAMHPRDSAPDDISEAQATAERDLAAEIHSANALVDELASQAGFAGQDSLASEASGSEMRSLTGPASAVTALLNANSPDARAADRGIVTLINTDDRQSHPVPIHLDPIEQGVAPLGRPRMLGGGDPAAPLSPGEVRIVSISRTQPITERPRRNGRAPIDAAKGPRVIVEEITPRVDGGPFAVKRILGRTITVEADVYTDGHELLGAELLWKASDEKEWSRAPLTPLGNDRWRGTFTPTRLGRHHFTVEGWRDDFGTLCHEIAVKREAGLDIALELTEARQYLEGVLAHAVPCNTTAIGNVVATLAKGDVAASVQALAANRTRDAVAASEPRAFAARHAPIALEVERQQAEFASWYELFPRSQTDDPARHGTFADVIARLPDIRQMGFDVLYFPPIHPIGRAFRKGRNNTLNPGPDDVGSPYAIGSPEGGHDAIHPPLGTLDDFRALIAAASRNGLEIALDFAIQCSPDHPWLRDHPGWFRWRPDGSIKYAENPPKKYQDIVNVDFYAKDAVPELWAALRDIVLFWATEGVRIFRVDNPHTKPLPFWQWMIADVRGRYPDVIFLAEAFTRPKMMYRLAKLGFSQSYTYFTWRNTKHELTDYLTELSTTGVKEFFRPHFFVNTPDINPYFLQTSGRAGFLIRAALATTLSGLWGLYAGFEFCEAAALPGREEYLDSEKYQIRVRDPQAPNITPEITALNRIRKANPALHSHLGITFYNAFNDQILLYGKALPSHEDMILVAVSLDPHHVQEATFELPLWEWQLPDNASAEIEDLMTGHRFVWSGKLQQVRLDPAALPFAIWRVTPFGRSAP